MLKLSQLAHIHYAIITTAVNKGMNGLGSKFVSTFILCYILTEVLVMNNVDEVIQVISIGLIVAGFLLNTHRLLNSIDLCNECWLILKGRAGIIDENLTKSFYKRLYFTMWKACRLISGDANAIEFAENILQIYHESGERLSECMLSIDLAERYCHKSNYARAKELSEKALLTCKEIGDRMGEARCYGNLGTVYRSVGKYEKARKHLEESLALQEEIGSRNGQTLCLASLGAVYRSVGEYRKAREYLEKSLAIKRETGDRSGEASSHVNLGNVYRLKREYEKTREYLEKALAIQKEIGDRNGEATSYLSFGAMYRSVGEYERAREHLEKSLAISKEIGDRHTQALSYLDLGATYCSLGKYRMANEHNEKGLVILTEIGDKEGEAKSYINQGALLASIPRSKSIKSKEYFEHALAISIEIGNSEIEAESCISLARLLTEKPENITEEEYYKAREHLRKALEIDKEIGDRGGEATCHAKLGTSYQAVGEYERAREHFEKSLKIQVEVGSRKGAAIAYLNLATVHESVGEYDKALDYSKKALAVSCKIGDRRAQASCYLKSGALFYYRRRYGEANQSNKKALSIFIDIGDREGIAKANIIQGSIEAAVGKFILSKEYFEKALTISKELRDEEIEAASYMHLGRSFLDRAEYARAEKHIKNALALSEAIGNISRQFNSLEIMGQLRIVQGKIQEAISYFHSAIEKFEKMHASLCDNDKYKISFLDCNVRCYRELSKLLFATGNPTAALYASELSRARALADLMSATYSVKNQISWNPLTWTGLEGIVAKGCNQTFLYVSYFSECIYLWIFKASGVVHHHTINGSIALEGSSQHLEQFFDFRSFGVLTEELCEDRSSHGSQPESKSGEEDSHEVLRIGEESKANQGPKMNLAICYKLIIAPVMNFLKGPEIIIVPDRGLYRIPFAALTDESGKHLSETFRIRVVPSLTTLKLINESPADHHCQTGALIVGNPDVGEVHFNGRLTAISRIPCAENEAKMIAEKLGVEPLLGQQATKQAVLQAMNSVALIHIAAHGDAECGAIALTPSFHIPNGIPLEELYLLTMSDISKVQLRAKLVVLSCCHSARGQTKAEGAVGIARAFLGSGARSVLVALWALHDKATSQLMTHFYDHLFAGKSAGESLHEAMKWMRSAGYDVNQWAPFILIGDDVTFDFGKSKIH